MSSVLKGIPVKGWQYARHLLSATTSLANPTFRISSRGYQYTSYPDANMTKYDAKSEDPLGCYLSDEDFDKKYQDTLDRLGIPRSLDSLTIDMLEFFSGKTEYENIDDPHKMKTPETAEEDIIAKTKIVTGWDSAGKPITTDSQLKLPWQYAKPTARIGGLIANVVSASLESERERNLKFVESIEDQIADEPGELAYVLQFYAGRAAPITFEMLNSILEEQTGKKLTIDDIQDEEKTTALINRYLDSIIPGCSNNFKTTFKKDKNSGKITDLSVASIQFISVHSSIILKYKLVNGGWGRIGVEVGRPGNSYVGGQLVINEHKQVVDPAVFQTMNLYKVLGKDLPLTIKELREKQPVINSENFSKVATTVPYEAIEDPTKKTSFSDFNLYGGESGKRTVYLSEGVPVGINVMKVPKAKQLAKLLYWVTGAHLDEALRYGAYFAHDAARGQDRACPTLALFGADIAGKNPEEFFPYLKLLRQYDLSQQMREAMLQNLLYLELRARSKPDAKIDMDFGIYNESTARNLLEMAKNGFVTMQVYKKVWDITESKTGDEAAKKLYDWLEMSTVDFKRRYRNLWQTAAFVLLNIHRTYGIAAILDPAPTGAKKKSPVLNNVIEIVKDRIVGLKEELDEANAYAKENPEEDEFTIDTSIEENALKLAIQALAELQEISKKING
ncbi:hypothetical protein [Sneathiella sp.]|uniref:hypothetical protein n=1 Tax=Sneathiella sp. TaxID=1964365 RepID=UPI002633DBA5|nr:hypothetical protein [Sneathiella sp.]MDF2368004.1 hypothetical protein [Sneathiella sp.]